MRRILMALCFLSSTTVFAFKTYELEMDLNLNGQKVPTPHLTLREGEISNIVQETAQQKTFIEVVAKEGTIQNHQGIMMSFVIGTIEKDGTKKIASTPQILANENESAQITVGDKKGNEFLSLSVLAQTKLQ